MESTDIYNPFYRFSDTNQIHATAIIFDNVRMGENNIIGPYSVIGGNGEIRGCYKFEGEVLIGSDNVISEHVTIQRPQTKGSSTKIGNGNIIMAHSHIGHNAEISNNCEISTGSIIGGYAKILNGVKLKLGALIRNRITVGRDSIIGMGAVVVKTVPDNSVLVGNPARPLK